MDVVQLKGALRHLKVLYPPGSTVPCCTFPVYPVNDILPLPFPLLFSPISLPSKVPNWSPPTPPLWQKWRGQGHLGRGGSGLKGVVSKFSPGGRKRRPSAQREVKSTLLY